MTGDPVVGSPRDLAGSRVNSGPSASHSNVYLSQRFDPLPE